MGQWTNDYIFVVPDPDPDPYRDTGKTCLVGGMHCPNASSLLYCFVQIGLECRLHMMKKYQRAGTSADQLELLLDWQRVRKLAKRAFTMAAPIVWNTLPAGDSP